MTNAIIVGLLIVCLIFGVRATIKHFKGEGGCCGGGSDVKIKPKKLDRVIKQRTVIVEGMTCEHCRSRVESCLNELAGVSARVNLKKKTAIVSMETEVSDDVIRAAIEHAGYQVESIS